MSVPGFPGILLVTLLTDLFVVDQRLALQWVQAHVCAISTFRLIKSIAQTALLYDRSRSLEEIQARSLYGDSQRVSIDRTGFSIQL